MKDECAGIPIAECVCLRPKMYSILMAIEKNIKKAKGVKTCVVKKQIKHEQYKETLFRAKQLRHGMYILRSEGHVIYSMHINKISLLPFDSKRWIDEDGVHTKDYGYAEILPTFTEMEAELSELLGSRWIDEDGSTEILPTFTHEELAEMEDELSVLLGW